MKKNNTLIEIILWLVIILAVFSQSASGAASASLSQGRNGTDSIPVSPVQWANGNLGNGTAHYVEGMSAPYQCVMNGLTIGNQVILTIGYDIKNSNKNAFDFLTHYDRLQPHTFLVHTTAETINPLAGTSLPATTPYTTYAIPTPSAAGTPMPGQPTNCFNAIPAAERVMTLYNGNIDTIYYTVQGSLTANQAETQIVVKFTPSAATTVLLWGGHIASRSDWGYTGMSPKSAGGISGSPFHMRLVSWNLGNLGNQDRSLGGSAVQPPPGSLPIELVHLDVDVKEKSALVEWVTAAEINNDYFTVERASENMEFYPVATVNGSGNSSSSIGYSWTDQQPLSGVSYYRLVQTDFDGHQKIYGPISAHAKIQELNALSVFSDHAGGTCTIIFESAADASTQVEVLNVLGRKVCAETVAGREGHNRHEFNIRHLASGVYLIILSQGYSKSNALRIIKE